MKLLGKTCLLLILIISQHIHSAPCRNTTFGGSGTAVNSTVSTISQSSYRMTYADVDVSLSPDTESQTETTDSLVATDLPTGDVNAIALSPQSESWDMTSQFAPATTEDVITNHSLGHMFDNAHTNTVENGLGRQNITDEGANNESIGQRLLVDITSYCAISVGFVSTVLNVLNIAVYCKKSTASATFIAALSMIDVLICMMFVLTETKTQVTNEAGKKDTFGFVWRNIRLFLTRLSHTINAVIAMDRFLVLSLVIKSVNMIQKFPKTVTCIAALFLSVLSGIEMYGLYVSRVNSVVGRQGSHRTPNCVGYQETTSNINTSSLGNRTFASLSHTITFSPDIKPTMFENVSMKNESVTESSAVDKEPLVNSTQWRNVTFNATDITPSEIHIFFKSVIVFNFVYRYLMLFLIVTSNIAAFVFLKRHAANRRQLGVSTAESRTNQEERRQSAILITMTTVYVLLGLPATVYQMKGIVKLRGSAVCVQVFYMKLSYIGELITTASDFLVFLIMSSSFRKKLACIICPSNDLCGKQR